MTRLRYCKDEDFKRIGINLSEEEIKLIETHLCPPLDEINHKIGVKNNFFNEKERDSFELRIFMCDKNVNSTCKDNSETEFIL